MSNHVSLWLYNKPIKLKTYLKEPIQKIANINNQLFVLTSNNLLYKGSIEEDKHVELSIVDTFQPSDIDCCKDSLYIVNPEGKVLVCDEELNVLNEIVLLEESKCSQGHSNLNHKVKVKTIAVSEFGKLYISENNQLWASGCMPQVRINSDTPKKIEFFAGRHVHQICMGADFATVLVSKQKTDDYESVFDDNINSPVCQMCTFTSKKSSESCHASLCPLGVKLKNSLTHDSLSCANHADNDSFDKAAEQDGNLGDDENKKMEKNIIFRNTEAAKDFLTRQISRMSSVGEEYLIECTEKPTRILKENMTNVASFVYEGVKTVGDKVATLSHHVSLSSDCISGNNNNECASGRNSKEDFLLSVSQSTSERDLSEMEVQENIDEILNKGMQLVNREVWMWGNIRLGCLVSGDIKKIYP